MQEYHNDLSRNYPHGVATKYFYGYITFDEAYEQLHKEGYDAFTIWRILVGDLSK